MNTDLISNSQSQPPRITPQHLYERWFSEMETENTKIGRAQAWKFFAIANNLSLEDAVYNILSGGPHNATNMLSIYKAAMLEKNLAPWTINTRLKGITALLGYARSPGLIMWESRCKLVRRGTRRDNTGPSQEKITELFDSLDNIDTLVAIRNAAIARLMYNPALRRFEVLALDIEHVYDGKVSIKGKSRGGREFLTLPPGTNNALQEWMENRPDSECNAVFISMSPRNLGQRIKRNTVEDIVRKHGIKCHGLRHTAITTALEVTNGDIRAVMKFSRHSSPQQVLAYDDCRKDLGGEVANLIDIPNSGRKGQSDEQDQMETGNR